ncbi:unnamed protein product [Ostreobium quekettii]|uniref:C3H1-type domain-containing protein n=1 Tax=Ostreobium quekettii TaxID=121088 RepID=A0A8S1IQM5_9CHLO|nr:unnamed protein product [Ostreobium quekettii]|eukprot:evm.model.scf_17.1 EVM.evm.TU.scf_17.1   scf_17:18942-19886(-)
MNPRDTTSGEPCVGDANQQSGSKRSRGAIDGSQVIEGASKAPRVTTSNGDTMLTFGRYNGKTYNWVIENAPTYADWAQRSVDAGEAGGALMDFADWSCGKGKLQFGKHRNKTPQWVWEHDRGYAKWAVSEWDQHRATGSSGLARFARFAKRKMEEEGNGWEEERGQVELCEGDEAPYINEWGYEPFECFVERYIHSHQQRGEAGYCWNWLDDGQCFNGMVCRFKHQYPPSWNAAKREQHRQKVKEVEEMESHMAALCEAEECCEEEGWGEPETEGSVSDSECENEEHEAEDVPSDSEEAGEEEEELTEGDEAEE